MKRVLVLAAAFLISLPAFAQNFVVHEWGTFTTLQGSDGTPLPGLYLEEEHLPDFVYHLSGFSPDPVVSQKGRYKPSDNVTVKMETPVLYFYANDQLAKLERSFSLRVDFMGGSISQWYPQRADGEQDDTATIDFARPYHGWIAWNGEILPADSKTTPTPPQQQETPTWVAPRETDANLVRCDGEVEKFLFYRGIGNFAVPLHASMDETGDLVLNNTGEKPIPYLFVYEQLENGPASVYWTGPLKAGEHRSIALTPAVGGTSDLAAQFREFQDALVSAGLYRKEAEAMLTTWRASYFDTHGLRVFWIVPRSFTDRILPIGIEPRPDRMERVLVGRSELLTPTFEKKIYEDFTNGMQGQWGNDR